MNNIPILKNLGKPAYMLAALGTSIILFDLNYYFMATLPGEQNQMCVLGAGLTLVNLIFTGVLSVATGILVAGLFALISQKTAMKKVGLTSLSKSTA